MSDEKNQPVSPKPEPESPSRTVMKAKIKEMQDRLARQEATEHSGAPERGPKARQFNIGKFKDDKDHHYRYVSVADPAKAEGRIEDGYKAVSEEECREAGARATIGADLRLMRVPREHFEERVAEIKELGANRLKAHKTEVREAVEAVQRELRNRGIDIPLSRLLVDE